MNRNCRGPEYCDGCPILELSSEEFSEQDRLDAVNSVALLKFQFAQTRTTRFDGWEASRLASEARKIVRYSSKTVSETAVRALERQVTGHCKVNQGE